MKIKAALLIILAVGILFVEKKLSLGLVVEVPLFLTYSWLIYSNRKAVAQWFLASRLPKFIVALVSALPFMLYEENLNCLPTGCLLIPPTIPILTVFVVIMLLGIKFFKAKNVITPVFLFSIFGVIVENTYGASSVELHALPFLWMVFFIFWIFVSYAFFAIIPATVLIENEY